MSKNSTNGQDYVIEERNDVKELCQADISLGPRTITTTNTKQPITITVGVFDAGNNEIKFPSKGYYKIHFEIYADWDNVIVNWVRMRIYNSFTSSYIDNIKYHQTGGGDSLPYGSVTFYHWCNDTRDRIQVFMEAINASVTNFKFVANSRVVRLLNYGL